MILAIMTPSTVFQLTPSRRATVYHKKEGETMEFQLTPSRRATKTKIAGNSIRSISTHALTEGDGRILKQEVDMRNFNSRPHGGRQFAKVEALGQV